MNVDTIAVCELVSSQVLQVTLVALVLAILVRLLCRRSPHLAYILLLVVVIKCLTPPLWSSPTSVFSWTAASARVSEPRVASPLTPPLMPDQESAEEANEPVLVQPSPEEALPLEAVGTTPVVPAPTEVERSALAASSAVPTRTPVESIRIGAVLLIIWAAGAILLAAIIVLRGFLYELTFRRTGVPGSGSLVGIVGELSRRMGLRRRVRICVTTTSFGPAVWGLWRPKLVLPQTLVSTSSPEDLERIIAHELTHVRRADDFVSALQILAQVLWWFHPLVWWVNRQICWEREHCCDEETIAGLNCDPRAYAQTLLDALKRKRQVLPLLAFATARPGEVTTKRLESIVDGRRAFHRRMPRLCWAALVIGLALVLPGAGFRQNADSMSQSGETRAASASVPDSEETTGRSEPSLAGEATADTATIAAPPSSGRRAPGVPRDMAIVDDTNVWAREVSPDGSAIAVTASDWSTARLHVAPYPPARLEDYRRVVEFKNATHGLSAVGWCHADPTKLALIVEQTKSHDLPRFKSRDELLETRKRLGLKRDDFEFVLYTVNQDGTNLRRICALEGGPLHGGATKGSENSVVWPREDRIYCYMEGRIDRVDAETGKTDLFFEESEATAVRSVFLDRQKRIVTFETPHSRQSASLLTLDKKGRVVERNNLSDLVGLTYLLYPGGSLYVDPHATGEDIRIMRLGNEDPAGTIPATQDGWMLLPVTMTPDERELVCSAVMYVVSEDGEGLPKKGEAIVKPMRASFTSEAWERFLKGSPEYEFKYLLEKLVRVSIPLGNAPKIDPPRVIAVWPPEDAEEVDPITEIRIRFDRPMDPSTAKLRWRPNLNQPTGFRPRGEWRYIRDTREFVLPVILTPGVEHTLALLSGSDSLTADRFRTPDGTLARRFSWAFRTKPSPVQGNGTRPKVVAIAPKPGSETGLLTSLRIRFDQPMSPDHFLVRDVTPAPSDVFHSESVVSVPFRCQYEADTHTFTLPLLFRRKSAEVRIELHGIRSAEGVLMEPLQIGYTTNSELLSPQDEERITAAVRDPELHKLVERIRRKRRDLTSAEITVRRTLLVTGSCWFTAMTTEQARFAFQGDRQFYADVSDIMRSEHFLVGSDGRECWTRLNDDVIACPYDDVDVKNVGMAKVFPAERYETVEDAIQALRLEYLGTIELAGRTCHRIRSWRATITPISDVVLVNGMTEWLIDAESLLPRTVETGGTGSRSQYAYTYHNLNRPIAESRFQSPKGDGIVRRSPDPLGEGYDRRFLNARDGSSGRMSVRWGKIGPDGRRSSSGLN